MPIGIGLGTAIAAGISGGAAVTGAVINSKSNNKSAQLQTDAANHAADLQAKATADALAAQKEEQAYERQQTLAQQQARAPYVALGNSSLASIAGRLGVPAPNFSAMSAPQPQPQTQTASVSPAASPSLSSVGSLASIYQPPVPASAQMNRDQLTASQTPQDTTRGVKVIAPTGETAIIAPADVARAVSLGAKVA